ncbi:hypothetical protein KEJ36_05320, partial [Candidatus Bathyarchaeota archaeon]|nr:hypothetical protein [Candidatus Bathyarchaeota archaeon]
GRPVPMKVAQVVMEVAGRVVEIWVAYGPNVEPILGMNVLRRLGIIVNTKDRVATAPIRRFTYRNLVFYGNFKFLYRKEEDEGREGEGEGEREEERKDSDL